ncbi:hypothetical protein RKD23_007112 [Streptomyces sp. SAI-170]|uniref:hypothetical protein n=1 Tax=Streptomyces sp. SAI-170 TaxID=3377729 RepID=UPI003C7C4896
MPIATRHRRNPVWLLTVLAAAACTAPPQHTNDPRPDAPTASAARATREPTPVVPPPLDAGSGETLAGRHRTARGDADFAYDGGRRGKALIVAVSCRGAGEVTVDLPALGSYFAHTCSSGEPAVIYNEFALSAAHTGPGP